MGKAIRASETNLRMYDPLSLRKEWKRLCICENEATIDYYHGSAKKLKVADLSPQLNTTVGYLIKPSGSRSMEQNPKKGQKMGRASRRDDSNRSCRFSTLPLLVCSVDTWEKSRLLTLKSNLQLAAEITHTIRILLYVVWGLGQEVFTKLRFWSCSKKFGIKSLKSFFKSIDV